MATSLAEDWASTIDSAIKDSNIYTLVIGQVTTGIPIPMAGTAKATNINTNLETLKNGFKSAFKAVSAGNDAISASVKSLQSAIETAAKLGQEDKVNELSDQMKSLADSYDPNAILAEGLSNSITLYLNQITSNLSGYGNLTGANGYNAKFIYTP